MNIWKESIEVLFLSFVIFLFDALFCDLLMNPTLRPTLYPNYIYVMLKWKVDWGMGAGGGGKWRQWSPENESAFVCLHCLDPPVTYLRTRVVQTRFSDQKLETFSVPIIFVNVDFIASLQKIEIESL